MRIAINAVLSYEKPRGVGVYFDSYIANLVAKDDQNEYFIFFGEWMDYGFRKIEKANVHLVPLSIKRGMIARNLYLTFRFPFLLKKYKIDFLHNIDTTPVVFKTTPIVSTIHDLSEFFLPEKYGKLRAWIRRLYVRGEIRKSDVIMTPSLYSKNSIVKIGRKKEESVVVVHNSVALEIKENPHRPASRDLLFVGEIEKTKNIEAIVKALPLLPEEFRLVVAGKPGNDFDDLSKLIEEKKLKNRVDLKGYVSLEELSRLYDESWLFVFPSLFEGFGIPLIEAMARSLPVVSSNSTCLPEVGGDACLYFDPSKPEELADKVLAIANDESLYQDLIKKGRARVGEFTQEKMSDEILAVYQSMEGRLKK